MTNKQHKPMMPESTEAFAVPAPVGAGLSLPRLLAAGRFAGRADVEEHVHPGPELVLVTQGHVRVRVNEEWLPGQAGTLFVLPGRISHAERRLTYAKTTYCVVDASPELLCDAAHVVHINHPDPIWRWIEDLYDLFHSWGPVEEATTSGLLLALLSRLRREDPRQSVATLHPALRRALAVIEGTPENCLDVASLAESSHISASHLGALFREHLGCGPKTYQRRLRLQRAARLLQNPSYQVAEVAALCGFDDANYFIRQFRLHHGLSPGQWRRKYLANP